MFKTRQQGFELKSKQMSIKMPTAVKIKDSADIQLGKGDYAVFAGKKAASGVKNISKRAVSLGAKTAGQAVYSELSAGYDESAKMIEQVMRYSGKQTTRNLYKGSCFAGAKIREKTELAYIKKYGNKAVTARTAFSPFKVRREAYSLSIKEKFKKEAADKMKTTGSKTLGKAVSKVKTRVGFHRKTSKAVNTTVSRIKGRVAKYTGKAIKKIGKGIRALTQTLMALLKISAGILLPLIIVVAAIALAIAGNNTDDTNSDALLAPLSLSGFYTEESFHIEITSKDEPVLSFDTQNTGNGFFYAAGSSEGDGGAGTSLNGKLGEENTIEVSGVIDGEKVVIKGTVTAGNISGYGLMGSSAPLAMNGQWINPFGTVKYTITSEYGRRVHPITGEIKSHDGYDLCSDTGENSKIYAATGGNVIFAGEYGGYGNCVIIDHGERLQSLYGHLNRITVNEGDEIQPGEMIGSEGNTGMSTGAHLHFEARFKGVPVDVLDYYPALYENASAIDVWQ